MTSENQQSPSGDQSIDEIIASYLEAEHAGQGPSPRQILEQHPEYANELRSFFADREHFQRIAAQPEAATMPPRPIAPADGSDAETLAPGESSVLAAGTTIRYFGDYELLDEIARGGMGVVYKAKQVSLNRIVALKMILAGQLAGEEDVKRFYTEAEAAANLQHPNIVGIHEVGEHEGQHYFSMDFIEGQSLAELVRDNPLPPKDAARYVQLSAEAIAYAHRQGTLHRDLKPANVLIDTSDQPKVTDFGLAKRMGPEAEKQGDEAHRAAALTATGAVLGTPSYMPPEQASGQRGAIGPASDVYSLGAVLYELVTGRPPFRAATPLDTLLQVLESEPAPPRALNAGISRDLETIILKCLNKEIKKRYASAQQLADDLIAFREGRPIKARRPSLAERGRRWLGQQGPTVKIALVGAVLLAAIAYGVYLYWDSQLGRVHFSTNGPALTAQVLHEDSDEPASPLMTVPARSPVDLWPGDYRLRLSGRRQMSETFHFRVEPGEERRLGGKQQINIELNDRKLWAPIKIDKAFDLATFTIRGKGQRPQKRTDIMHYTQTGLERINGATGQVVWTANPSEENATLPMGFRIPALWTFNQNEKEPNNAPLLKPAFDVDGDGTEDLIFCSRHLPSLLTISGKTGKSIWLHRSFGWLPAPLDRRRIDSYLSGAGSVVGKPAVVPPRQAAADGTGPLANLPLIGLGIDPLGTAFGLPAQEIHAERHSPLLVASMASPGVRIRYRVGKYPVQMSISPAAWLEGISSRTGRVRWRHFLPYTARSNLREPELHSIGGERVIVCVAGEQVIFWNPEDGSELHPPVKLPVKAQTAPPRFVDLDGKPGVEMLLWRRQQNQNNVQFELLASQLPSGKIMWRKQIKARWVTARQLNLNQKAYLPLEQPQSEWPLVIAPGGDAEPLRPNLKRIIVVPDGDKTIALDGATGRIFWQSDGVPRQTNQAYRMQIGPDLDGDGYREVFQVRAPRSRFVLVEALSGQTGERLWFYRWDSPDQSANFSSESGIRPLRWLPAGPDGWPVLLVPVVGGSQHTLFLSAGEGILLHEVADLYCSFPPHDLDGDGLADPMGWRSTEWKYDPITKASTLPTFPGWLHSFRWYAPDVWRRMGEWETTQDLNGDGIAELVNYRTGQMTAVSGSDGRVLWRSSETGRRHNMSGPFSPSISAPLPLGDFNGDGTPDVLVFAPSTYSKYPVIEGYYPRAHNNPLCALCGKSGERLWLCEKLKKTLIDSYDYMGVHKLDPKGDSQVVFIFKKIRSRSATHSLVVFSAKTGKLQWKSTLPITTNNESLRPVFADLNGDGVQDMVFALPVSGVRISSFQLCFVDGTNGQQLKEPVYFYSSGIRHLIAGDVNGDGKTDLLVRSSGRPKDPAELYDGGMRKNQRPVKLVDGIYAIDGNSGDVRLWWKCISYKTSAHVLLRGKAGPVVAVSVYDPQWRYKSDRFGRRYPSGKSGHKIFFLDRHGKELANREIWKRIAHETYDPSGLPAPIAGRDVNGDEVDELLTFDDGKLVAFGPNGSEVWKSPALGQHGNVLRSLPAKTGEVIAVQILATVFGVSGTTGNILWRSDGPGGEVQVLPVAGETSPPRIISRVNHQKSQLFQFTMCRLALPTIANGDYLPEFKGKPHSGKKVEYVQWRQLPWVEPYRAGYGYVRRYERSQMQMLNIGLFAFFIFSLWLYLSRGWRGLLVPLGLGVLFIIGQVVLFLLSDRRGPYDQYIWEGWQWMILPPLAFAGGLTIPVMIIYALIWGIFRMFRRGPVVKKTQGKVFRWVMIGGFLLLGVVSFFFVFGGFSMLVFAIIASVIVIIGVMIAVFVLRRRGGQAAQ